MSAVESREANVALEFLNALPGGIFEDELEDIDANTALELVNCVRCDCLQVRELALWRCDLYFKRATRESSERLISAGLAEEILRPEMLALDGINMESVGKVLRSLSRVPSGQQALVRGDLHSLLLRLLKSQNKQAYAMALHTCFNISSVNSSVRLSMMNSSIMPSIVEAIVVEDEGQCAAVGTVANLATEMQIKNRLVEEYDIHTKLLKSMSSECETIINNSCRAFFGISANTTNKPLLTIAGCIEPLTLKLDSLNDSIVTNAAGALANLAIYPPAKQLLVKIGILSKICRLGSSRSLKVQRQMARCMFSIAASTVSRNAMISAGCLSVLRGLIHSKDPGVAWNAIGALGNIAMSDEFKSEIIKMGFVESLLGKFSSNDERIQGETIRAIFTLSAVEAGKRLIYRNNGISKIVPLLGSANENVQRDSAGALANLSIGTEYKQPILQSITIPVLSTLIRAQGDVQSQATRLCFALSSAFTKADIEVDIEGTGSVLTNLKLCCTCSDSVVRMHSTGAIANISNRFPAEVFQLGIMKDLTKNALCDPSHDVRKQSYRTIRNLFGPSTRNGLILTAHCDTKNEMQHDMTELFRITMERQALARQSVIVKVQSVEFPVAEGRNAKCFASDDTGYRTYTPNDIVHPSPEIGDQGKHGAKKRKFGLMVADSSVDVEIASRLMEKSSGFDPDICVQLPLRHSNNEIVWHNFYAHAIFLAARSPLFDKLISKATYEAKAAFCQIRVPMSYASTVNAWNTTMEFLYTDRVSGNASLIRERAEVAKEVFELASRLDLPLLASYCQELEVSETYKTPSTLQEDMKRIWKGILLSEKNIPHDIKFRAEDSEGKTQKAHKVILASRCSFFKARFGNNILRDSRAPEIQFPGCEAALILMLQYLYCGIDHTLSQTLNHNPSLALQVLILANEYGLTALQMHCEFILLEHIEVSTVNVVLRELEYLQDSLLRVFCIGYIVERLVWTKCNRKQLEMDVGSQLANEMFETAKKWGLCQA